MNLKAVIITICLLGCLLSGISTGQESRTWEKLKPRTWTAVNGKSNEGTLIGVEGNQVSLSINGKAIPIKLEKLSPADQAYITKAKNFMFDELLGFDQVTVSSVSAEGISITHVGGIARIPIQDIPVELRKQFGMDSLVIEQKKKQAEEREKSWKYSNLEWDSTSEVVIKSLQEKGFVLTKKPKFLTGNPSSVKTKSGQFHRVTFEFEGGTVLGHTARLHCEFANDQLFDVTIFQTTFAALKSEIVKVLTAKYGKPYQNVILGNRHTSFSSKGDGNKTRISHRTFIQLYGNDTYLTSYQYESDISKLVSKELKKDKENALKKKADASDL